MGDSRIWLGGRSLMELAVYIVEITLLLGALSLFVFRHLRGEPAVLPYLVIALSSWAGTSMRAAGEYQFGNMFLLAGTVLLLKCFLFPPTRPIEGLENTDSASADRVGADPQLVLPGGGKKVARTRPAST